MMRSGGLPRAAQAIVTAVSDGVRAARAADAAAFDEACVRLASCDHEHVRLVLATVVRTLLEDLHPGGLAGEDLQEAIEDCVRSALNWRPEIDPGVLVVVLTGAFGIHEPGEEEPRIIPVIEVAVHALLLIAELLKDAGSELADHLGFAIAEIARAETVEMP